MAKGKGYKRSWKNLLLNKRYQLRFTLFMVIMSGVLMGALGWWVMSAAAESTIIGVNAVGDKRHRECVKPPKVYQVMQPETGGIDLESNDIDHTKKQKEPGAKVDDIQVDIKKPDDKKDKKGVKVDDIKVDIKTDDKKDKGVKVDDVKVDIKADDKKVKVDDVKVDIKTDDKKDKKADDKKAAGDKAGADDKKPDGDKKPDAEGDDDDDDDDDGDIADDEAYRKWKNSKKKLDVKVVLDVEVNPAFAEKAITYYTCQLRHVKAIAEVRQGQDNILWVLIAVGLLLMIGLSMYGIKMTHKVAGPLHKVSLYFAKMRDENYDKVWNLRKGDQLVEFYDHFKSAHEGVVKMQNADIDQLKGMIEAADAQELGAKSPEVAAALDELREVLKRKEASLDQ